MCCIIPGACHSVEWLVYLGGSYKCINFGGILSQFFLCRVSFSTNSHDFYFRTVRLLQIENPSNCVILYLGPVIYVSFYEKCTMKQPQITLCVYFTGGNTMKQYLSLHCTYETKTKRSGEKSLLVSICVKWIPIAFIELEFFNSEKTASLLTAPERIPASCS